MPAFIQPSFAKGVIAPSLYGRVDTAAYQVALRVGRNCIVHPYGGVSNRAGLEWIGPARYHNAVIRLIPFSFKTTDDYMLEFGNLYVRVIRNDAYVTEATKTITGITAANPGVVTSVAHGLSNGDEVYLAGIVGMTRLNGRRFLIGGVTADTFQLKDQVTGINFNTSAYAAYTSGGTAARIYTVATSYITADLPKLKYVQSADVMTLTHAGYAIKELSRTGHTSWTLASPTFAPVQVAPASFTVTPTTPALVTQNYQVTAVNSETFEESLPVAGTTATGNATIHNTLAITAASGAGKYNVYRQDNGTYGFIGSTETTTFVDDNIEADVSLTPPKTRDPFSTSTTRPGAAGYHEQRRVFGGSTDFPDRSEYSKTGSTKNFSRSSPLQQDDAFSATLNARQVNEIRHYISGKALIILTSGSEFQCDSGSDAAFAAETIRQKPQSFWGSSHHQPIISGNTILFVEENLARVRSLGYSLQIDGYTGTDLTLLANHYFSDRLISDWAYARSPDAIAHVVGDDGDALAMTFQQEQEVIAWTHWDTLGKFEAVGTLRHAEGERDDRVYFCVKRKVNGQTVRYVERVHSRQFTDVRDCFFVDSGLSYDAPTTITGVSEASQAVITAVAHGLSNGDEVDIFDIEWEPDFDEFDNEAQPDQLNGKRYVVSDATADTLKIKLNGSYVSSAAFNDYVEGGTVRLAVDTVTGYDHLEGRDVVALCDGNVVSNLTVENGAIELPRKFSRVHAGLKYIADVETLDIEINAGIGTFQAQPVKVNSVVLRLEKTRGLFVGKDQYNLEEFKQRKFENMGEPTALLTGDSDPIPITSDWDSKGRVFIRQRYPLPMTLLAVIPDLSIGGTSRDA